MKIHARRPSESHSEERERRKTTHHRRHKGNPRSTSNKDYRLATLERGPRRNTVRTLDADCRPKGLLQRHVDGVLVKPSGEGGVGGEDEDEGVGGTLACRVFGSTRREVAVFYGRWSIGRAREAGGRRGEEGGRLGRWRGWRRRERGYRLRNRSDGERMPRQDNRSLVHLPRAIGWKDSPLAPSEALSWEAEMHVLPGLPGYPLGHLNRHP